MKKLCIKKSRISLMALATLMSTAEFALGMDAETLASNPAVVKRQTEVVIVNAGNREQYLERDVNYLLNNQNVRLETTRVNPVNGSVVPAPAFNFNISNSNGLPKFQLQTRPFSSQETIGDLKEEMAYLFGAQADQIRIMIAGKPIQNEMFIDYFCDSIRGVNPNKIHVVYKQ